uniref:Uncharacterized protein n=1 Tax=Elaeophora elaphi TaxID=1147741 RepID=A0A0R3RG38_9BILA
MRQAHFAEKFEMNGTSWKFINLIPVMQRYDEEMLLCFNEDEMNGGFFGCSKCKSSMPFLKELYFTMSAPKIIIVAVLLVINHFCFNDSKRLQDNDFARQFLFRGGFEPLRYYLSPNDGLYITKRVPSAADMMIRFGKRFARYDVPSEKSDCRDCTSDVVIMNITGTWMCKIKLNSKNSKLRIFDEVQFEEYIEISVID